MGCLTRAFSGAHKWAEVLRNPGILEGPQTRGPNKNWLPHACLLGGPHMGGSATSPLHSQGSPNKRTKSEVAASPVPSPGPTSGQKRDTTLHSGRYPNKGTKLDVAASPVHSRGPTSGRKGYITPAFLAVPKQGDKISSGCLTPAFSGAHGWVEVLRNPCTLRGPLINPPMHER